MRARFVQTSNVRRFLGGVDAVEHRGAPEACLMLVTGDAGHGKSKTGQWYGASENAVFLRTKAATTPHWMMRDLVAELGGTQPGNTTERLFGQALTILAKEPRPIVVDEIEHTLRDITVLETLRDLTDMVEVPLILLGREYVAGKLKLQPQLWSRISSVIEFQPATLDDVRLCANELIDIDLAEDAVAAIHKAADGRIREVIKALAVVERAGRRLGRPMTAADLAALPLCHDAPVFRRRAA
ncbi:AAA family ATPase [Oceanibaculum indicum]|uniref:ORC1/DEAH AAA+ ATPase domain-containing protein n=1 Tax=Oceanibaculum indicum P24 TaxID=1207063 RepID=K2J5V6_9PROT|nr:ATP-binding protein [Oceanibaculum indicum]EKE78466.1 hypothetical protein P24_02861 [Oceanibaculum indicum P24]